MSIDDFEGIIGNSFPDDELAELRALVDGQDSARPVEPLPPYFVKYLLDLHRGAPEFFDGNPGGGLMRGIDYQLGNVFRDCAEIEQEQTLIVENARLVRYADEVSDRLILLDEGQKVTGVYAELRTDHHYNITEYAGCEAEVAITNEPALYLVLREGVLEGAYDEREYLGAVFVSLSNGRPDLFKQK